MDRRERLDRLSVTLAEGGQDLEGDEAAVVQAAAEITGLTAEMCQEIINGLPDTWPELGAWEEEGTALRKFAELAKKDE